MTNLMRHYSNGEPMNEVLKNEKLMVKIARELKIIQKEIENEVV